MTAPRLSIWREDESLADALVGDLWRVVKADPDESRVTLERVAAPPGTYRKPGDGLHPRVPAPDTRPISDAEAKAINDQMDAALDAERDKLRAWAFSPDNPLNSAGR